MWEEVRVDGGEKAVVVIARSPSNTAAAHSGDLPFGVTLDTQPFLLLPGHLVLPAFASSVEDGGIFGEDGFGDDVAPVAFEEADFAAARQVAEVFAFAPQVVVNDVPRGDAFDAREECGRESGVTAEMSFQNADVERAEIGVGERVVEEVFGRRGLFGLLSCVKVMDRARNGRLIGGGLMSVTLVGRAGIRRLLLG
jgi:hypothetical protein